jgi:hypothetical protein
VENWCSTSLLSFHIFPFPFKFSQLSPIDQIYKEVREHKNLGNVVFKRSVVNRSESVYTNDKHRRHLLYFHKSIFKYIILTLAIFFLYNQGKPC